MISVLILNPKSEGIFAASPSASKSPVICTNPFIKTNKANNGVRRKPPGKLLPSAQAVDREYKVITALNKTDVPVPKTFSFCEDVSVVGTPFFLMEHVKGSIYWDLLLPQSNAEERRKICLS